MSDETVLVLDGIDFPVGSARGITQSLGIIDNGDLRRTVNGTLTDTTRAVNQKFVSSIKCTDMSAPTLAEIWKGSEIEVQCIAKIRQRVSPADDIVTLTRPPVSGSVSGYTALGAKVEGEITSDSDVVVEFEEDVVRVEYRPLLVMMVTDKSEDEDEYQASTGWSLELEEV